MTYEKWVWMWLGKKWTNKQANKKMSSFQLVRTCYNFSCWQGERPKNRHSSFWGRLFDLRAKDTFSRFLSLLHVFSIVRVYLNLGYKHFPPLFRLNYSPVLTQMRFICSEKTNLLVSGTSQRKRIIKISDVTKHLPCSVLPQLWIMLHLYLQSCLFYFQ